MDENKVTQLVTVVDRNFARRRYWHILLNDTLGDQIDLLAQRFAALTGEPDESVRRGVEIAILQRGIRSVTDEVQEAEEREAAGQKAALG